MKPSVFCKRVHMRRTSIKDIARIAEVSHSTVSRALSGSPLISPETTERIRRIAEESGYRRSAAARSLVTSRTATIGVVVTTIADPFAAEVVNGIEDAANDHDYSVILASSNVDPEREMRVVRALEERRVDGIIVTSSRVGASYAGSFSQKWVPIVLLNNQHHSNEFIHSVMIDNHSASAMATQHLIGLGHRRIAYIGDRNGYDSDTERFDGFRAALDQAGIEFRPDYVAHGNGKPDGGAAAMNALLAASRPPTAVFCYNDMTALGALRSIRTRGLSVPADISVAGFDDLFVAEYSVPPLTTVRQPMREMGWLAVETLIRLLAGVEAEHNVNIKVPGELVVRESTAPPKESL